MKYPRTCRAGRLAVDLYAQKAWLDGQPMRVSATEYVILKAMALAGPNAIDVYRLTQIVYGKREIPASVTTAWIAKLRGKVEEDIHRPRIIVNVRNWGYLLEGATYE